METTKTGRRLRIPLPLELMDILRWHVASLPDGPMRDSELLFPSLVGGYRAPSCLDKPIREIATAAKIGKALTPRLMRRTFQDLGRAADVHDFVVRAISGHATTNMQEHYGSVSGDEVRKGLARSWFWRDWQARVDDSGGRGDSPGFLTTKSGYVSGHAKPPSTDSAEPEKQKAQGLPGLLGGAGEGI